MTASYDSLLFAGECFFGASLILGLAGVLARQGSASQRHFVWAAAFVALLILPLAAAIVPARLVFHLPAAPALAEAVTLTPIPAASAPSAAPLFTLENAVTLLFAIWTAGVLAVLAHTAFGLFALYRLHRRSVPHIPGGVDGGKFRGAHWQLRLRTMPGNEGPLTYGLITPTVLLPKASVRWPRAQLELVLLHEFAHVCRKDCLTRLIARAACAFHWPNPFVWSAAAHLRRDAEIAADDYVLQAGVRASAYADALVGLARDFGHDHPAYAGVGLSMAERSGLKARVQAILSAAQPRMGVTRMDMLKVVVLGAAVTAGLVLLRPSLADALPEAPMAVNDLPPPPPVPDAPPAPEAPPVPPPVPAAPPAPPAHHVVRVMHFTTPNGEKVMKWESDGDVEREMAKIGPEIDAALAKAKPEIDKAMAAAMKAQRQAKHLNQTEIRKMMVEARASRVRALEQARDEINRQLAEARKEAADAQRQDDAGQ